MPSSSVQPKFMDEQSSALTFRVEVVCALPSRQELVSLQVPPGTTAREVVTLAKLQDRCPEVDVAAAPLAVYGVVVNDSHPVRAGDRVEILRPLQRDPRDARRELAARGKTMLGPGGGAED